MTGPHVRMRARRRLAGKPEAIDAAPALRKIKGAGGERASAKVGPEAQPRRARCADIGRIGPRQARAPHSPRSCGRKTASAWDSMKGRSWVRRNSSSVLIFSGR